MICAACRAPRELDDLLAYWPVGDPDRRRFVCRPTRPSSASFAPCFARVVGFATEHAISLAAAAAPQPATPPTPIRPDTGAWARLLQSAGIRAA